MKITIFIIETTKNDMGSNVLQEVQHHVVATNLDHAACHPTEATATCTSEQKVLPVNLRNKTMCIPENCLFIKNSNDITSLNSGLLLNDNLPLLPPCRICGEKASGFHYGANTCEACKVSSESDVWIIVQLQ
jgi:hypothetical protein